MKELIRKILKEQMEEDIYKKISPTDKIHMSHEDKLKFRNISPQDQPDLWKPKGLWYSIGDKWIKWIEEEGERNLSENDQGFQDFCIFFSFL